MDAPSRTPRTRGSSPIAEDYRVALLDWLACAAAGREERAARVAASVADGLAGRVAAAGAAGHVLDFDDTWLPGLAHLSAAAGPAALVVAAAQGRPVAAALEAYAEGFEATAALAGAGHPLLYERGWHPTAVCGTVGAAVAAAVVLGQDEEGRARAAGLAALRAAGLQAAFGTDGKALQVGLAAAAGVEAARLAAAGAQGPGHAAAAAAWEAAYGAPWVEPEGTPAVRENWIKAYPCCLQTHSAIEAAAAVREGSAAGGGAAAGGPGAAARGPAAAARGPAAAARGPGAAGGGAAAAAARGPGSLTVVVHPVSRRAAAYDDVADGLQAKFSLPYLVAFTLLHGPPGLDAFAAVEPGARALARSIAVRTDAALAEPEARLERDGALLARVEAARGSPWRPLSAAELRAKVEGLAPGLAGVLDDEGRPAAEVLAAAGM